MTNFKNNKTLNVAIWVAQVLLFGMFAMAGAMKLTQPLTQLSQMLPWVSDTPLSLVRFIGLSELLGGIGILLPSILRIQPKLSIYAAYGLVLVMIFASIFHSTRGEFSMIGTNIFLLGMAIFVAWGRMIKVPIQAK